METLKKDMQRVRRQYVRYNKAPKTREDINLPEDCTHIITCNHKDSKDCTPECKEEFLAYDSGIEDPERFLIFGTKKNIDRLKRCIKVYSDGTFKRPKKLFAQVSLHTNISIDKYSEIEIYKFYYISI